MPSAPIHAAWAYLAPRDSTKPHVYMDEGQWWWWCKEDSHVHGPYPSVHEVAQAHG